METEFEPPHNDREFTAVESTLLECSRLRMVLALHASHHMNPPRVFTAQEAMIAIAKAMMERYIEDTIELPL